MSNNLTNYPKFFKSKKHKKKNRDFVVKKDTKSIIRKIT